MNYPTRTITANGINIYYHRSGGNKPPLVLCHGITDNGLCWTRVAEALQDDFDLLIPDARGHGLSEAPEDGYNAMSMTEDLADFLTQLNLKGVYLLGHSMGAEICALVAAHFPGLASKLVLEDPPWRGPTPEGASLTTLQQEVNDWKANLERQKNISTGALIAEVEAAHPAWNEFEFRPWATAKQMTSPNVFGYITEPRPHWTEIVSQISCPSLLITGDASAGAIVSPQVAAEIAGQNANFKIAHLPGAGHSIRRDQFEPYVEAVQGFLGR